MDRRHWIAGTAAAALTGMAHAQTPGAAAAAGGRKVVLMSLVGNELVMVSERQTTGSNINQNERRRIPMQGASLDTAIGQLLQVAVKKKEPGSVTTLVAPTDASLFEGQDQWFLTDTARLPSDVLADLRGTGASQLLLLVKLKADAALRVQSTLAGTGQLEGLGYYVNHTMEVGGKHSLNGNLGFLAPYAYLRIALIDLASARVLAQQRLTASQVVTSNVTGDPNPWNAIPDNRKMNVLLDLVGVEVERSVPQLLAAQ